MQPDGMKSLRRRKTDAPDAVAAQPVDSEMPAHETDRVLRTLVERSPAAPDGAVVYCAEIDGFRYQLTRTSCALHSVTLSPREREIARMVAKGLPDKAIAAVLEISRYTVSTHLRRMYAKAGVATRAAMVAKIMAGGFGK
jgi:DNA-binding CsgD family transcriptional regulator